MLRLYVEKNGNVIIPNRIRKNFSNCMMKLQKNKTRFVHAKEENGILYSRDNKGNIYVASSYMDKELSCWLGTGYDKGKDMIITVAYFPISKRQCVMIPVIE